jgi:hypothetical protein
MLIKKYAELDVARGWKSLELDVSGNRELWFVVASDGEVVRAWDR